MSTLTHFFEIEKRQSTVGREVRGGITTFLTMAYILFVNADILSNAGMPKSAVATSTALAACICSLLMGVWANFPLGLASGMGLNAFFAFTVCIGQKLPWQTGMGLFVIDGLVILLLVIAGLREAVLDAIPKDLRMAIGGGIGLFIAFIGLQGAGLVVTNPATLVGPGKFISDSGQIVWPPMIAVIGLILIAVLMIWRVTGAILIGIVACTVIAVFTHVTQLPADFKAAFAGPDFSVMFHADVVSAFKIEPKSLLIALIMSVVLVDFFDTLGTATAVAEEAGLMDEKGRIPRIRQVLMVDSLAASIGGLLGASSVTGYIESASGVAEGARTGLQAVVVGVLFLIAMFFAPLFGIVPACATAPALILVGFLMMAHVAEINFKNFETAIPAFLTVILIPLTFSIAHGVGYGFIAQVVLSVLAGNARKVHPLLYIVAAAFVWYFWKGY
jgi:adenine/guanine/hypoxanthine permease